MKSFLTFITESTPEIEDAQFNYLEDLNWEVESDWDMTAPHVWSKTYSAGDLDLEFEYDKTSPYRRLYFTVRDTSDNNKTVVEGECLHGSLEENVEADLERVKEDLKHDFGANFVFSLPVQAMKEGKIERKIKMIMEKEELDRSTGYDMPVDQQMTQAEIDIRDARDAQEGLHGNPETSCLHTNGKTHMSIDFTTICPKRREGSQCAYCYVEDARRLVCNAKKLYDYLPYRGEILKLAEKHINILNDMGGLRFFSTGDYMPAHDADIKQALEDAQARNLRIKVITKQPKFVEKYANHPAINVINVSVDKLACGMPAEVAYDLRDRFPEVVRVRTVILNSEDYNLDFIQKADLHTMNHSMADATKTDKKNHRYYDHNGFETWTPGIAKGAVARKAAENPGKFCCGDSFVNADGVKVKGCYACKTKCGKGDIEVQLANPRLGMRDEKVELAQRELDAEKRKQSYEIERDGAPDADKMDKYAFRLSVLQKNLDDAINRLNKDNAAAAKKIAKKAPIKATPHGNVVANSDDESEVAA